MSFRLVRPPRPRARQRGLLPPQRPFHFRARPGRTGGCTEPLIYSSNVLFDGGFESHLANTGGGPEGDEIPEDGLGISGPRMVWSDDSGAPDSSGWMADTNYVDPGFGDDVRWIVSTANPRSGSRHGRYSELAAAVTDLWPVTLNICAWPDGAFGRAGARVEPGDNVNWSFWFMVTSLTGGPRFGYGIIWLDQTGDWTNQNDQLNQTPATSYTQYSINANAPAGAYFALPFVGRNNPTGTPPSSTFYDIDDAVLAVST